jgi:hypothetical protein
VDRFLGLRPAVAGLLPRLLSGCAFSAHAVPNHLYLRAIQGRPLVLIDRLARAIRRRMVEYQVPSQFAAKSFCLAIKGRYPVIVVGNYETNILCDLRARNYHW